MYLPTFQIGMGNGDLNFFQGKVNPPKLTKVVLKLAIALIYINHAITCQHLFLPVNETKCNQLYGFESECDCLQGLPRGCLVTQGLSGEPMFTLYSTGVSCMNQHHYTTMILMFDA